ncbi:MAG: hypothetical protein R3E66_23760 [bacterium]
MSARILSAFCVEDSLQTSVRFDTSRLDGLRVETIWVAGLRDGWQEAPDRFKSGAGPIFALQEACRRVEVLADVVVIRGYEPLRTGISPGERARAMDIYDGVSVPEAYTRLAQAFCKLHGITESEFLTFCRAVEANCRATAHARGLKLPEPGQNDQMVTSLYRRADCANPVIDFEGELIVGSERAAKMLGIPGTAVGHLRTHREADGPDHVGELAQFVGLDRVLDRVTCTGLALEVYTCFPIVPLGFLYAAGLATSIEGAIAWVEENPLTISGGMNFARAPWNCPALRALVLAHHHSLNTGQDTLVHGNGGLGGWQGVAVLTSDADTHAKV